MAVYSIKDLEKISGIKAHTIRIWERRYALVQPKRTSTNIRYYSDDDLKKLLNISILNQNGFKISKIAHFDEQQLRDRVLDLCLDARNNSVQIESMMVALLELDERKFLNVLSGAIIKYGFEDTVEFVLFPFLDRIGTLWQAGTINPAQEHFISNLIRQKLIVAIDNEMQNLTANGPRMIFFLPEGEMHEIGLLFFNFLARKEGLDVVYLGMSVPLGDLKQVNQVRPADAFFTSFVTSREKNELESLLQELRNYFPDIPFFVNGLQFKDLNPKLPGDFTVVSSIKSFKEAIRLLKFSD
ncbi:MerR family transcriptional regulator [Marinilabilia rubra]|uniref:MerR family transcriptional regulator n=1 Tax=Marinilabilia rubra TaxID=2162893 RepID=A0A2U2B6Y4_9BACT|nr:MerR family transcriptional regulator [Marinilabilia rubra]PWD98828.1 MerR family transcriptional regulator [Marinilabilia rubra]